MRQLGVVWAVLVVLTFLEVALALPRLAPPLFLAILLALSIGKSALIVSWFMEVRIEPRWFSLALFPPLAVLILALLGVLVDAERAAAFGIR